MNIFYLDQDVVKCAKYHFDKHVNVMIKESAQMLSTATWCLNPLLAEDLYKQELCYLPTHINHPCNIWVRESNSNFLWLKNLAIYLNEEKKYRFESGNHKSIYVVLSLPVLNNIKTKFTKPALAITNKSLHCDDPVLSYRNYYMTDKRHMAKWTNREIPHWWK